MKDKYRVIYQPKGAAREYSELALNIYTGCPNGCKYCYVPSVLRKSKDDFHSRCEPRKDISLLAMRDLQDMSESGDKRRVLLSFTCDPYPSPGSETTRDILTHFEMFDINFQVLTKGGLRAIRDFDLYKKGDLFATTLTFDNERDTLLWEPSADFPSDRIMSLKRAKAQGIETWVSFEPVVYPEQTYNLFERSKYYVDMYKIGKINHFPEYEIDVDWKVFTHHIIELCEKNNKKYMIKDSLKKYL